MNLFAYGTLQFPDILGALCGQRVAGEPALLPGHRRQGLRGLVYPAVLPTVVPMAGAQVQGVLYRGLTRRALRFVAAFERGEYRSAVAVVTTGSGERVPARYYVAAAPARRLLDGVDWDPRYFAERHRARYVRRVRRLHRAWCQRMPPGPV
ncbi:MAG TPA: gamma-glutamylcyclotransferase family protein [Pseudomonadales bacterium]|nr:gamma-glutamylcyclotransferase family protein [Pseudomonadales bacterium]